MTSSPRSLSAPVERHHLCDRCGERMDERKCKIICPNCGFFRDCSDP
jgi:ribosomal protein L37E